MSQSDDQSHDHPDDYSDDQSEDQLEGLRARWKVRQIIMSIFILTEMWRIQHVTDMDDATRKARLLELQANMLDILQTPHFHYERLLEWMERLSPYLYVKGVCLFRKGILCYKG